MQTMHTGQPIVNEAEELRRFTGTEFALVQSQPEPPSMFIIQKRERISPDEVRPLAVYFIMNNRIYQSPDLYTVLSNRLLTSLSSLQSSLDILRRHRPDYTPRTGFVWPITDSSMQDESTKKRKPEDDISIADDDETSSVSSKRQPTASASSSEAPKRQQNNMLLLNAMRTTAAHMKRPIPSAQGVENVPVSDAPPVYQQQRMSATPAPSSSRVATPKVPQTVPAPQEPAKGLAGAGKKKRKRTLLAPQPAMA